MSNNCRTKRCSCEDAGLHIECSPCTSGTYTCPDPNPCAENFSDKCIIHTGDPIQNLSIETGDPVSVIWEKIAIGVVLATPECIDGSQDCQSVLNFRCTAKSDTSVILAWTVNGTLTGLTLEYGITTALGTTVAMASATTSSYTLTGLTEDTLYYFRMTATNGGDDCYSVIIKVQTNESS